MTRHEIISCRAAKRAINRKLDGLLDSAACAELARHLEECSSCAMLDQRLTRSVGALRRAVGAELTPQDRAAQLTPAIMARVRQAQGDPRTNRNPIVARWRLLSVAAACLLVAGVLPLLLVVSTAPPAIASVTLEEIDVDLAILHSLGGDPEQLADFLATSDQGIASLRQTVRDRRARIASAIEAGGEQGSHFEPPRDPTGAVDVPAFLGRFLALLDAAHMHDLPAENPIPHIWDNDLYSAIQDYWNARRDHRAALDRARDGIRALLPDEPSSREQIDRLLSR